MAKKPKKTKPKLKRLSLKGMRFKEALKLFATTTPEDLENVDGEKRDVKK